MKPRMRFASARNLCRRCATSGRCESRRCGVAATTFGRTRQGTSGPVEASIEADGRQAARNTGRMTFNDTPPGLRRRELIGSPNHSLSERPDALAQAIIDRSRGGEPDRPASRRDGFPAESFALAARPLIDGCAEFVRLRPIPGSGRYGGPGGQLQRGLVTALRVLDHRRGRSCRAMRRRDPGARCASMDLCGVRGCCCAMPAELSRTIRCECSSGGYRRSSRKWLAEHPPLMEELRAVLAGSADASSAIAELVERAATGSAIRCSRRGASCADGVDRRRGGGER